MITSSVIRENMMTSSDIIECLALSQFPLHHFYFSLKPLASGILVTLSYYYALLKYGITCRLMEEVDEFVGDKESVDADDLENLKYMQQVCTAPAMYPIGK